MTHMPTIGAVGGPVARRHFAVTQNAHGYWVARESGGLIEGVFVKQRDAVRFALFETGGGSPSVVAGGAAEALKRFAAA